MVRATASLFYLFWCCIVPAQPVSVVQSAFHQLNKNPTWQRFAYNGRLPKVGGHLQGIQIWQSLSGELPVLTGSSGNLAYCLIVQHNLCGGLQMLDTFPFRHAGGCQIAGDELVVGVEDNIAKDKSEIVLVQLSDTGFHLPHSVLATRSGTFKRSTAGATAACYTSANQLLVAVADWDTRHIDFYHCAQNTCDSLTTLLVPDSLHLPAYQAINLVSENDRLFLIGFAQEGNRNHADLLQLQITGTAAFTVITSRYFRIKRGASFRYGAGLQMDGTKLKFYATQRNLKRKNIIAVYR